MAFADLSGIAKTMPLAETALAELLPQHGNVKPDSVVDTMARTFNLSVEQMLSPDRSHDVILPRQIAMYLMRETNVSLPQIGQALGRTTPRSCTPARKWRTCWKATTVYASRSCRSDSSCTPEEHIFKATFQRRSKLAPVLISALLIIGGLLVIQAELTAS